jgi:pimeloyl-ACP methyl ester carboxylesterase
VLIDPAIAHVAPPHPWWTHPFDEELDTDEGWAKFNRHYWLRDYRGFLQFYAEEVFCEPHSTKQIEDFVGWGLATTAETLVLTQLGAQPASAGEMEGILRRVRCPVLVIHGTEDAQVEASVGADLAAELRGRVVLLEGPGTRPTPATRSR